MRMISLILAMTVLIVLASFTVLNAQTVSVHFLLTKAQWPLAMVMLLTFIMGMILALILLMIPLGKQALRNKLSRYKIAQLEKKLIQNQDNDKTLITQD